MSIKNRLVAFFLAILIFIPLSKFFISPKRMPYNRTDNKEIEGKPVTIHWNDSQQGPQIVAWMQGHFILTKHIIEKNTTEITIPRKGINHLPQKIMIIPRSTRIKPEVMEVDPDQQEVTFIPEKISSNDLWLWGFTPENPCSIANKPTGIDVQLSLGRVKNQYNVFYSAFVWKITRDANEGERIPLLFATKHSDILSSIKIKGFGKANAAAQTFNNLYTASSFPFALETTKEVWGKSHKIQFEENDLFDIKSCKL